MKEPASCLRYAQVLMKTQRSKNEVQIFKYIFIFYEIFQQSAILHFLCKTTVTINVLNFL